MIEENITKKWRKETGNRSLFGYVQPHLNYIEWLENEYKKLVNKNDLSHGVRGCFYSQNNVIEILENAHDLKDAITIIKEGNDGDNNP